MELRKKYPNIFHADKTVGLHVRTYYRDWLENKKHCSKMSEKKSYKEMLIPPDFTFLKKAIEHFPKEYTVYVFSDYIPWCKKHLKKLKRKFIFVENEHFEHDFYLLSRCKNQIFANSTFAFWAAYLNPNPDKKVIVRIPWSYQRDQIDDLILDDWIQIKGNPNPPPVHFKEYRWIRKKWKKIKRFFLGFVNYGNDR